jgi:hypothetical protein
MFLAKKSDLDGRDAALRRPPGDKMMQLFQSWKIWDGITRRSSFLATPGYMIAVLSGFPNQTDIAARCPYLIMVSSPLRCFVPLLLISDAN